MDSVCLRVTACQGGSLTLRRVGKASSESSHSPERGSRPGDAPVRHCVHRSPHPFGSVHARSGVGRSGARRGRDLDATRGESVGGRRLRRDVGPRVRSRMGSGGRRTVQPDRAAWIRHGGTGIRPQRACRTCRTAACPRILLPVSRRRPPVAYRPHAHGTEARLARRAADDVLRVVRAFRARAGSPPTAGSPKKSRILFCTLAIINTSTVRRGYEADSGSVRSHAGGEPSRWPTTGSATHSTRPTRICRRRTQPRRGWRCSTTTRSTTTGPTTSRRSRSGGSSRGAPLRYRLTTRTCRCAGRRCRAASTCSCTAACTGARWRRFTCSTPGSTATTNPAATRFLPCPSAQIRRAR